MGAARIYDPVKPQYAILESRDKNNDGKNGDAMSWPELQTMQTTYRLIAQGERPWNALGDFLNYWFGYATNQRAELVREPIQMPAEVSSDLHRWAAFCAASVEYLCERYGIPCPAWALHPTYTLTDPWFTGLGAERPQIQARLRQETPAPFLRHNIFCGNRIFANKYELAERVGGLSSTVPSAPPTPEKNQVQIARHAVKTKHTGLHTFAAEYSSI